MTRLLVSVRSAKEALAALAGGADLIDVKEPRLGSLGAASSDTLKAVADVARGQRPLSAALGELTQFSLDNTLPLDGYSFAKWGHSQMRDNPDWSVRWRSAMAKLPESVAPVAVVYADYQQARAPSPAVVCKTGSELGCRTLLIDTFEKKNGSLMEVIDRNELNEVVQSAQRQAMLIVLAGSLKLEHLEEICELQPDIVAVRGAVCNGSREDELAPELVRLWAERCHTMGNYLPSSMRPSWSA